MVKKRGEDRHISKSHHENPLPPGIKILVAYTGLIAFFYLVYFIFGTVQPVSLFFGNFIYGNLASLIEMVSWFALIAIIYGLVKKHYWAFYVSLIWFIYGALNAVISLFTFNAEFDVLKNVLVLSSFVIIILNGIIAWYIYSEKHYFKVKHLDKETKAKDKFFVYIISSFIVLSVLVLATFGIDFYRETIGTTKKVVLELNSAAIPELTCAEKEGNEKDICYLVLSIMQKGNAELCENIESDFYKMTCYRAIE